MAELFKLNCTEPGCACVAGRVTDDLKLEVYARKHHGQRHDPQIDLRSLLLKIERAQPELLTELKRAA